MASYPLQVCCGFYCASVAIVGVYFFIVIAIMEFRSNPYLVQIVQIAKDDPNQPSTKTKGTAFLITAGIQVLLAALFWNCGKHY